jgi:PIN domain nuclease of toxin-antitoxin system
MRLLLDTHVFLWYIAGDERLHDTLRTAIQTCETAYLSVVSLWEASIKYRLGKLPLSEPPGTWLQAQRQQHGIESLDLAERAVARLDTLPLHHRDPFDRMLVCQSLEHDLQIVTVDALLLKYPARFLTSLS